MKACGNRTLFQCDDIYHPTDGNVVIARDDIVGVANRIKAMDEDCEYPECIRSITALNKAIRHYNS